MGDITNRWTRAAGACFASYLIRRWLNEIAPPRQLNRSPSIWSLGDPFGNTIFVMGPTKWPHRPDKRPSNPAPSQSARADTLARDRRRSQSPKKLRRLSTVGCLKTVLKHLYLVCQTTAPARFGRNLAFLSFGLRGSCEDCPVWGEILTYQKPRKGHPAKVVLV
jgi:hypothetical protein